MKYLCLLLFFIGFQLQAATLDRSNIPKVCQKMVENVQKEISFEGVPILAIFDFRDVESKFGQDNLFYFSEKCREEFVKSKKYTLVERTMLDSLLKELDLQNSAIFDQNTSQKIGKMTGAQWIVTGDVFAVGENGELTYTIYEIASAKILYKESLLVKTIQDGSQITNNTIQRNFSQDEENKEPFDPASLKNSFFIHTSYTMITLGEEEDFELKEKEIPKPFFEGDGFQFELGYQWKRFGLSIPFALYSLHPKKEENSPIEKYEGYSIGLGAHYLFSWNRWGIRLGLSGQVLSFEGEKSSANANGINIEASSLKDTFDGIYLSALIAGLYHTSYGSIEIGARIGDYSWERKTSEMGLSKDLYMPEGSEFSSHDSSSFVVAYIGISWFL